jgi:hypothetical protein
MDRISRYHDLILTSLAESWRLNHSLINFEHYSTVLLLLLDSCSIETLQPDVLLLEKVDKELYRPFVSTLTI